MPQTAGEQEAIRRIQACLESGETCLDLDSLGLTEIPKEIEKCTHLEELSLEGNNISIITELKYLVSLKSLCLSENPISDIKNLKKLTQLEYLDMLNTNVSNINAIINLKNLKVIDISITLVKDLYPLKKINDLEDIRYTMKGEYDLNRVFYFMEYWVNKGKYLLSMENNNHKIKGLTLYLTDSNLPEVLWYAIAEEDHIAIKDFFRINRLLRTEAFHATLERNEDLNEDLPAINAFQKPNLEYALKFLVIKDFQCIQKIELRDLPTDAQFIVFTGENGDGKTSILQALSLGLCDASEISEKERGTNSTVVYAQYQREEFSYHNEFYNTTSNTFLASLRNRMIPVRPFAAYGASRLNVSKQGEPQDVIKSFYAEQPELIDITTALLRDLAANDKTQFDAICNILVELLPNVTEIRKKDPNKVVSDLIFQEKGKTVEFKHLSAGHKSILLMIGDMIIRLSAAQPHITDPKDYAGIVLIDEIEAHLHPKWQKEFPHLLSRFFPKVQFIVTTHSAITLLGMPENTVIFAVKRDETKGTMVERVDIDLKNLLPNHILTSPVFGLDSLFSVTNENDAEVRTEDDYKMIEKRDAISADLKAILKVKLEKEGKI